MRKLKLEFNGEEGKKVISYEEFKKKQEKKGDDKPKPPTPGGAALPLPTKKAAMKHESSFFSKWLEAADMERLEQLKDLFYESPDTRQRAIRLAYEWVKTGVLDLKDFERFINIVSTRNPLS